MEAYLGEKKKRMEREELSGRIKGEEGAVGNYKSWKEEEMEKSCLVKKGGIS